jgi:hypothetical protein
MRVAVGIDVAKTAHWVTAIDDAGTVLIDRSVANEPDAIEELIAELRSLEGEVTIGLDVVGGIAGLAEAMLAAASFRLVHVPGLAVNRARQGTTGGEAKSDPRDARVIADQVRTRHDLRTVETGTEIDLELRLLVGRRRDLVDEQTRRLSRLHGLLVSIHPGLERVLDLTTKGSLWLLTRYVTPAEIRRAGHGRLVSHLKRAGGLRAVAQLADAALASAQAQRIAVPGERMAAIFVRELAAEALAVRKRLAELDRALEARLTHHPDAASFAACPAWGPSSRLSS